MSLLFLYNEIIVLHLHSSGIFLVLKMTLNNTVSHSKLCLPKFFRSFIDISFGLVDSPSYPTYTNNNLLNIYRP